MARSVQDRRPQTHGLIQIQRLSPQAAHLRLQIALDQPSIPAVQEPAPMAAAAALLD
jgi:L-asparaginase/Glu-tRNA(Gln) amidotransferase subunit D